MKFGDSPLWVEQKYANLVSARLERFKLKKSAPYLANFRCHICGDSATNKLKARGYLYEEKEHLHFKCWNCGNSAGFSFFLKGLDDNLYKEYQLECLKESGVKKETFVPDIGKFSKPRFAQFEALKAIKKISQLPHTHPAVAYVKNRLIPPHYHYKLYFAPKFAAWVNLTLPGKLPESKFDEPRLIIPFIDQNGYLFGFQGRSFKKTTDLRYITVMLDDSKPKIFGLDTFDPNKLTYVLEGPIDSMFVYNSLAFAGADGDIDKYVPKDKAVIVYDNEPRNEAIVKKIFSAINNGYRVVIWPDHISSKDINDLALSGMSQTEIMEVISTSTFKGLAAMAKFNQWKRVSI